MEPCIGDLSTTESAVAPEHSAWALAPRIVAAEAVVLPLPGSTGVASSETDVGDNGWIVPLVSGHAEADGGQGHSRFVAELPSYSSAGYAILPLPRDVAALEVLRSRSLCLEIRAQVAGLSPGNTIGEPLVAEEASAGLVVVPLRYVLFHAAKVQARRRSDGQLSATGGTPSAGIGAEHLAAVGVGGTSVLHSGPVAIRDPLSGHTGGTCFLEVRVGASSEVLRCIGQQEAAMQLQRWVKACCLAKSSENSRRRVLPHLVS